MKTFRFCLTLTLIFALVSTASVSANQDAATTATAELSGIEIDLGTSGDALFNNDRHEINEGAVFTRESFTAYYGTAVVIIDILSGDIGTENYRRSSRADIAATYNHTDWIGGSENPGGFWDMYSGAYKLDYRELVYLELSTDPKSDLLYGVGVYDSATNLPDTVAWVQKNVTIDGISALGGADISAIEDAIAGQSDIQTQLVELPLTTVADWEDAGLVSETSWESPNSDVTFSWDGDNWRFRFDQPDSLSVDSSYTNLKLHTGDRNGEVQLQTVDLGMSPDEYLEMITSEDQLESMPFTELIDTATSESTAGAIMLQYSELGDPIVIISDAWVNEDGVLIITTIYSTPENIGEVYESFWNNVQSNGEYYPLTWTLEEIEALDLD